MIYTAPRVIVFMRAGPLLGELGGGLALEISSFLGPLKWHEPIGECHLGPPRFSPSNCPPYSPLPSRTY